MSSARTINNLTGQQNVLLTNSAQPPAVTLGRAVATRQADFNLFRYLNFLLHFAYGTHLDLLCGPDVSFFSRAWCFCKKGRREYLLSHETNWPASRVAFMPGNQFFDVARYYPERRAFPSSPTVLVSCLSFLSFLPFNCSVKHHMTLNQSRTQRWIFIPEWSE